MTNKQLSTTALSLGLAMALSVPMAGHAQIDPRSLGTRRLAAGGPTGQYLEHLSHDGYAYFDRFGLRYFREDYPGTQCWNNFPSPECYVEGEDHVRDVYFPDTRLAWI